MPAPHAGGDSPAVALVIQRRIADAGFADVARWHGKLAETLQGWPGFLGQDVVPPQPPAQVDWVTVLHFQDATTARQWLQSETRTHLMQEISQHLVGPEDVHLLPEAGQRSERAVSAILSFRVAPEQERAFLAWQPRIQAAEAGFAGFLRHQLERPVPGLHDDWVLVLSFDTDAHLEAWLQSPERQALLAEADALHQDLNLRRASHGFQFWYANTPETAAPRPGFVFQCNLLVLLVLYPVVYLWGHFIGEPWLGQQGVPFWLALFVGNLVSTQILGWWLAPAAFRVFGWWLAPNASLGRRAGGYGLLAVLYGLSMWGCAWLLR